MSYKSIKIKFTEFSDFGRISMEISGVTYTVDVESQQHLKAQLNEIIGYISFISKKK
jgi:hypothetical protein